MAILLLFDRVYDRLSTLRFGHDASFTPGFAARRFRGKRHGVSGADLSTLCLIAGDGREVDGDPVVVVR